uniref:MGT5A-like N-terminal domain-containing protein n=1 Tax=Pavo cristatus TaxID=9049 RepID=A0A8C9EGQ6_PAVCR
MAFSPWKLSSQKLGFFLVTFGFIWGMMLLHFTIQQQTQHESSSVLREQILDLSKRYIKALAEENKNVVDGPYVGTVTAYDLKKTLAVLLDNILQRIGKLESKVENLVLNGTGANSTNNTTTPAPSLGAVEKLNVAGGYSSTFGWLNLYCVYAVCFFSCRYLKCLRKQNSKV